MKRDASEPISAIPWSMDEWNDVDIKILQIKGVVDTIGGFCNTGKWDEIPDGALGRACWAASDMLNDLQQRIEKITAKRATIDSDVTPVSRHRRPASSPHEGD